MLRPHGAKSEPFGERSNCMYIGISGRAIYIVNRLHMYTERNLWPAAEKVVIDVSGALKEFRRLDGTFRSIVVHCIRILFTVLGSISYARMIGAKYLMHACTADILMQYILGRTREYSTILEFIYFVCV